MRQAIAVLLLVGLAGCGGSSSTAPAASPAPVVLCPAVDTVHWPKARQQALRAEIDALPAQSNITDMAEDWIRMRDEARACAKGR